MRRALLLVAALIAPSAGAPPPPPPTLAPCLDTAGAVAWTQLAVAPAQPVAGSPVTLTGVGAMTAPVAGGAGEVSAFLFGSDVFDGAINTCGADQSIDVLGLATISFNGLACPLAIGANANLNLSLVIPAIAQGIGAIGVTVNATDGASGVAYCLNMTVFF